MAFRTSILLAGLAIAAVACAGSDATGPRPDELGNRAPFTSGGSNDTTPHTNFPASVHAFGRTLTRTVVAPDANGDTLALSPVGGVRVEFWRNQLVNGQATSTLIATTTSNAAGEFSATIPGGYYVVKGFPASGSGYADTYELFEAGAAESKVDLFLWKGN